MKILNTIIITVIMNTSSLLAKDPPNISYITGVGSTHFEAHRMAINAANRNRMTVHQELTQISNNGLWNVILRVSSK